MRVVVPLVGFVPGNGLGALVRTLLCGQWAGTLGVLRLGVHQTMRGLTFVGELRPVPVHVLAPLAGRAHRRPMGLGVARGWGLAA